MSFSWHNPDPVFAAAAQFGLLVCFCATLAGCAATTWVPGPGLAASDFRPDKARCLALARSGHSVWIASGSCLYVAGAELQHDMNEAAQTEQEFNACMMARGWRMQHTERAASVPPKATLRAIQVQGLSCMQEVTRQVEFSVLLHHLRAETRASAPMAAAERLPTPEEGLLLSSYLDQMRPCLATMVDRTAEVVPEIGAILRSEVAASERTMELLVERRITWSTAARRVSQERAEARERLHAVHL